MHLRTIQAIRWTIQIYDIIALRCQIAAQIFRFSIIYHCQDVSRYNRTAVQISLEYILRGILQYFAIIQIILM